MGFENIVRIAAVHLNIFFCFPEMVLRECSNMINSTSLLFFQFEGFYKINNRQMS